MHFIFLLYESRSGSTMLAKTMASRAADLLALPELRLIEVLLAEGDAKLRRMSAQQIYDTIHLDHQLANLRLTEDQLRAAVTRSTGRGVTGIVEEVVTAYAASRGMSGVRHVLVKAGGLLYLASDLRQMFSGCHLLHIYRDARGVVNSVIHNRRPYFPEELMGRGDPVFMAKSWKRYVTTATVVRTNCGSQFVELPYETLCSQADETIGSLFAQLGIQPSVDRDPQRYVIGEAEQSIHKLVAREPLPDRLDAWKSELLQWQGVAVEAVAGREMAALGYRPWFSSSVGATRRQAYLARAWCLHYWRAAGYYLARLRYYSRHRAKLANRLRLLRVSKG